MADPRIRTIKIKTGIVKRLTKEKFSYEKEAKQQKERVEKIKSANKDDYNLKKQEEIYQECLMMLPDCTRRLQKGITELKNLIDNESDLTEEEAFVEAVKVLQEGEAAALN